MAAARRVPHDGDDGQDVAANRRFAGFCGGAAEPRADASFAAGIARSPAPRARWRTWHLRCSSTDVTETRTTLPSTATCDFERETKWCEACSTQVRFLMSVNASYCVCCGSKVRLFSKPERARFAESVQKKKYCSA